MRNATFRNNYANGIENESSVIQASGNSWMSNDGTMSGELGYKVPYQRLTDARQNAEMTYLNSIDLVVPTLTLIIEDCEFIGNRGEKGYLTVMSVETGCLAVVRNCVFSENYSEDYGNLYFSESEAYFENCTFSDNYCHSGTAGIHATSDTEVT